MRQWAWWLVPIVGMGLLIVVALPSESPSSDPMSGLPTPLSHQEKVSQEAAMMRDWARKSGGDFNKLPPDVQGYIDQVSMGHGREWLRNEAERQKKEEHKGAK